MKGTYGDILEKLWGFLLYLLWNFPNNLFQSLPAIISWKILSSLLSALPVSSPSFLQTDLPLPTLLLLYPTPASSPTLPRYFFSQIFYLYVYLCYIIFFPFFLCFYLKQYNILFLAFLPCRLFIGIPALTSEVINFLHAIAIFFFLFFTFSRILKLLMLIFLCPNRVSPVGHPKTNAISEQKTFDL